MADCFTDQMRKYVSDCYREHFNKAIKKKSPRTRTRRTLKIRRLPVSKKDCEFKVRRACDAKFGGFSDYC